MKKHTLIIGGPATGKTRKVAELISGKSSEEIGNTHNYLAIKYELADIVTYREVPIIVIDGLELKQIIDPNFRSLLAQEKLTLRKPYYREKISVAMPQFIITCICHAEQIPETVTRHFEIIDLDYRP